MAPKQRMRLANEKHSQNVNMRGNVPKTAVRKFPNLIVLRFHVAKRPFIFF